MRFFPVLLCAAALALNAGHVSAQPDLHRSQLSIAERGSAYYDFETLTLKTDTSPYTYRVVIAKPRKAAPASGYPVLYLLDGNAALEAVSETLLVDLSTSDPPVLVAIGYDTPLRFDVVARSYDYTPPLLQEIPQHDPLDPARLNGGASQFLDFILNRVKPEIASRMPVHRARQGLWGHSYGGLFVFYTLLTSPNAFSHYIAASPSLWWGDGWLLGQEAAFTQRHGYRDTQLLTLRGSAEGTSARPGVPTVERLARRERALAAVPADALAALTGRLDQIDGMDATYIELQGLEHGPMLSASIPHALHWMLDTPRRDDMHNTRQVPRP